MKKEWTILIFAFLIYYANYIINIDHETVRVSNTPFKDFAYLLFSSLFFILVIYVLIPRFFYKKKFILFAVYLVLLSAFFGIFDEGIVEKILYPQTQGRDVVSFESAYWFFGENIIPLLSFITIKILFDNIQNQKIIAQAKNDSLDNELKFLRSQIQPHVLFNNLNNLYEYTLSKSDKAPNMVLKLSKVLRYVLYETQANKTSLMKELDFIRDYIELQKIQLEGRGNVILEIKEDKTAKELRIVPFIIIPFVENSFKHSLGTLENNIQIKISIILNNSELKLNVSNNFDKSHIYTEHKISKGIGLKNVKKRLEILYPKKYQLNINDNGEFYDLYLNLQLEE